MPQVFQSLLNWIKSLFVKPVVLAPVIPIRPLPGALINREHFFKSVIANFGHLDQSQVDGFNAMLAAWDAKGLKDLRYLAYMLATAWHETAKRMQAIKEYGSGHGHSYGAIDPITGHAYYGRGLVQLTWADNYKKMGKILGIELYENPDLALDLGIAIKIMFEGMIRGIFTGKSLENYFNEKTDDPVGARHIINGSDKASLIAGYHAKFLDALA